MALAEGERRLGLTRTFPGVESGVKTTEKPRLYTQKEITLMEINAPPDLQERRIADTPVGTWHMDGQVAIFDPKPEAEIAKITKISARRKLATIVTKILNIS